MSLKSKLEHSLAISLMASSLVFSSGCRSTGKYCCSPCDSQAGVRLSIQRNNTDCGCDSGGSPISGLSHSNSIPNSVSTTNPDNSHSAYNTPPSEIVRVPEVDNSPSSHRKSFPQQDAAPPVPSELTGDTTIRVDDPQSIQAEPLSADEAITKAPTPVATERDSGDLKTGWDVPQPEPPATLTAPAVANSDSSTTEGLKPPTVTPAPKAVEDADNYSTLLTPLPIMEAPMLDGNGGDKVPPPVALVSSNNENNGPIILRAKVVQPLIRPLPFDVRQSDGKRLNPGKPIVYANPGNPADQNDGLNAPFAIPASSSGRTGETKGQPSNADANPTEKVTPPMKSASAVLNSSEPQGIILKARPKASEVDSTNSQKPFFTEPLTPMLANPPVANEQQR